MSTLLTAPTGYVDGPFSGPNRDRITTCKLCPYGIYPGGEPAVWLRSPLGLSHKSCADTAGLNPAAATLLPATPPLARKDSHEGPLPEPTGRRSGSRDASPAARTGATQEQARPRPPVEKPPAPPRVPVPAAEPATPPPSVVTREQPAAPDGEWHYLLDGQRTHFRLRHHHFGLVTAAVCGIAPLFATYWLGGEPGEQQAKAARLGKCTRCQRWLKDRRTK